MSSMSDEILTSQVDEATGPKPHALRYILLSVLGLLALVVLLRTGLLEPSSLQVFLP